MRLEIIEKNSQFHYFWQRDDDKGENWEEDYRG
jgi:hypothetical protein